MSKPVSLLDHRSFGLFISAFAQFPTRQIANRQEVNARPHSATPDSKATVPCEICLWNLQRIIPACYVTSQCVSSMLSRKRWTPILSWLGVKLWRNLASRPSSWQPSFKVTAPSCKFHLSKSSLTKVIRQCVSVVEVNRSGVDICLARRICESVYSVLEATF